VLKVEKVGWKLVVYSGRAGRLMRRRLRTGCTGIGAVTFIVSAKKNLSNYDL